MPMIFADRMIYIITQSLHRLVTEVGTALANLLRSFPAFHEPITDAGQGKNRGGRWLKGDQSRHSSVTRHLRRASSLSHLLDLGIAHQPIYLSHNKQTINNQHRWELLHLPVTESISMVG